MHPWSFSWINPYIFNTIDCDTLLPWIQESCLNRLIKPLDPSNVDSSSLECISLFTLYSLFLFLFLLFDSLLPEMTVSSFFGIQILIQISHQEVQLNTKKQLEFQPWKSVSTFVVQEDWPSVGNEILGEERKRNARKLKLIVCPSFSSFLETQILQVVCSESCCETNVRLLSSSFIATDLLLLQSQSVLNVK